MLILMKLLLCLTPSFAQFANYNSVLLGDRAAGMGGAGTALPNDVSSAAYYNPALLSQTDGTAFSAAVGIYKKYDINYGSEIDYTKNPLKASSGFFRSLPASTGNVVRKNGWSFGLSILVPEYETFKGDLQATNTNTSTLTYTDESLWVGPTLSHEIDEKSAWGFTLYYTARNFSRSVQDRSYPNSTQATLFNSEETVQENALVPILGYMIMPSKEWTFGVSFRNRGIAATSNATYFESLTRTNPYSSDQINQSNLSSVIFIPAKLSLGVSHSHDGGWIWSANLDAYEGLSYETLGYQGKGSYVVRNSIANISLGIEKTFTDWFKVRLGAFSNLSPYPNPDGTMKRFQGEHVDQTGVSANVVFVADNKIAYTFGGYYTGGRGRAIERINQDYQVITKSQQVFTMLAGTQFYF
ncbi:MAG: hypothetical protein ACXVCP_09160 [Bdellovibrio sp.]